MAPKTEALGHIRANIGAGFQAGAFMSLPAGKIGRRKSPLVVVPARDERVAGFDKFAAISRLACLSSTS